MNVLLTIRFKDGQTISNQVSTNARAKDIINSFGADVGSWTIEGLPTVLFY